MKAALFALAVVAGLAGPAAAFDAGFVPVQERGWDRDGYGWRDDGWRDRDDGRGWRERRDWRQHRDWRERRGFLSEREVARGLMRRGFVRIESVDLRRDRYVVRAVRPNGALIRLAVDAYDGSIIARERIGWVAGGDGFGRRDRGPANGAVFDLGTGTLGIYSR